MGRGRVEMDDAMVKRAPNTACVQAACVSTRVSKHTSLPPPKPTSWNTLSLKMPPSSTTKNMPQVASSQPGWRWGQRHGPVWRVLTKSRGSTGGLARPANLRASHRCPPFLTGGPDEVLQRGGAVIGVDHVAGGAVAGGHPAGKLGRVGERRGEEGHARAARRQRDALLPHHAPLRIAEVVDLVKHQQRRLGHHIFYWEGGGTGREEGRGGSDRGMIRWRAAWTSTAPTALERSPP